MSDRKKDVSNATWFKCSDCGEVKPSTRYETEYFVRNTETGKTRRAILCSECRAATGAIVKTLVIEAPKKERKNEKAKA